MSFEFAHEFETIGTRLGLRKYPSPLSYSTVSGYSFAIKHDEQLDLGCSKQRSLSYMIAKEIEQGSNKFTISSSGNAALVAAYVLLKFPKCSLRVYFSKLITDAKLAHFLQVLQLNISPADFRKGGNIKNVEFYFVDNPKQQAFQLGQKGWVNLRGSQEELALPGFRTIAYELIQSGEDFDAVFVPASSGTTALGIYAGFQEIRKNPAIHVVQTTKVNALVKKYIAREEVVEYPEEPAHPAESIVDVVGHRRGEVEAMLLAPHGTGWIINADECEKAKRALLGLGVIASYDASLTFAAYKKSLKTKRYKNPVLVFTG